MGQEELMSQIAELEREIAILPEGSITKKTSKQVNKDRECEYMKCPICDKEMQEGGLIIDGVASGWVPMEQFQKKGVKRIVHSGLRTIGKTNILSGQTKISNAFFCKNCNKIVGVFDITNNIDD